MSLDLPSYLRWLGWVAGSAWPEGDEDRMWGIAGTWRAAAGELRDLLPDLDHAKSETIAAYPWGNGIEAMTTALDKLDDGKDESIQHLADIFDQVGDAADNLGTELQYTKIMIISSLGLLAVELAAAWGFPPTAPITEAIETAASRVAIRILGDEAEARIAAFVERKLVGTMMKFLAKHVLFTTAIGAGQDFAIQLGQILGGTRHGFDWEQFGITTLESAAAGAVGGPAGEIFDNAAGKIALPVGRYGNALGQTLKGATVGTAAGIAGGVAAWGTGGLFYGWQWDNKLLTSTASYGALVGGSKGFRGDKTGTGLFGKSKVPDAAGFDGDGSVPSGGLGSGGPKGNSPDPDPGGGPAVGQVAGSSAPRTPSRAGEVAEKLPELRNPSAEPEEGEAADAPHDPATADTPYTTRNYPEADIPAYQAPNPPSDSVWDNPKPHPHLAPKPRPEPAPHPGPSPEPHAGPKPHAGPEPHRHHESDGNGHPRLNCRAGVDGSSSFGSSADQGGRPRAGLGSDGAVPQHIQSGARQDGAYPGGGAGVNSGGPPHPVWHSGERSADQVVVVRSLTGLGGFAGLDTETGAMHAVDPGSPGASTELGGVLGHFDGIVAVFYRDGGDLMLRVGAVPISLDDTGASVDWHRISGDTAYFRVLLHGVPSYEMRYRSDPADGGSDLGRFVRDVLADPVRRTRLFSR